MQPPWWTGLTNVGLATQPQAQSPNLEQLRDNEKALAKQTIAVRSKAHDQAFDGYIDAYVAHTPRNLSGSIGNATQLPAILGTASELNGDTSVAKSVADLANAVNDVNAAYRHIGAADAVDEVIRTIEQRGTSGLVNELTKRAGEEQQPRLQRLQCRPIAAVRGHDPVFDGFHRRIHGSA